MMDAIALLSDDEVLAGSTDDRINRLLLRFRDHAKEVDVKLNKHIKETDDKFKALEEKFRLQSEQTERAWELKFNKMVEKFNKSEKKQENEQVLSEFHNKKYNMIINNMSESHTGWESNIESIEKVQDFFKNDLGVPGAENMRFVNAHRMGDVKR